jgi:hypothetical protein
MVLRTMPSSASGPTGDVHDERTPLFPRALSPSIGFPVVLSVPERIRQAQAFAGWFLVVNLKGFATARTRWMARAG